MKKGQKWKMRLNYGEIFITKTHKNITKTG